MAVAAPVDASELLGLWERASEVAPAEREDVLLGVECGAPPASLGRRNAGLVALRARLIGRTMPLRCDCPQCGATAGFIVDCEALASALLPENDANEPQRLAIDGFRIAFRVPTIADLRHAARAARAVEDFVGNLFDRCITSCERDDGAPCMAEALSPAATDAVSRRMEELEPGATVSFELACPECTARWTAPLDAGAVLWAELQARAERLLSDVDALARAYGWTEPQILALGAPRRAAYLSLIGAV